MCTLETTRISRLLFSLPCVLLFVALQHPLKEQHRELALEKGPCAPYLAHAIYQSSVAWRTAWSHSLQTLQELCGAANSEIFARLVNASLSNQSLLEEDLSIEDLSE